jgi:hypothetical protein
MSRRSLYVLRVVGPPIIPNERLLLVSAKMLSNLFPNQANEQ